MLAHRPRPGKHLALDQVETFADSLRHFTLHLGDGEQFTLGMMYANGLGVPKDEVEALKWYRKAAAQGNVRAQRELNKSELGKIVDQYNETAKGIIQSIGR